MKITYFGHAFFLLDGDEGPTIAIDPYDESIGYPMPSVTADYILASHEHFDHAHLAAVGGKPPALVGAALRGRHELGRAIVEGFPSRHYDDPSGAARGENTVMVVELDGLRVCHLGDLGHVLDQQTAVKLGRIDLLMVPVGGFYTLDVPKVDPLVELLAPRVVIPMHYRTAAVTSPGILKIAGVDEFLRGKTNVARRPSTITVAPSDLPAEREIWVMAYASAEQK